LFETQDVLYILGLKKELISVSFIEDMGSSVMFKKGKVLIHLEGAIHDIGVSIGVREGNLYRLKGNSIQESLVHENDNPCEI
jgi:hypothetical protein